MKTVVSSKGHIKEGFTIQIVNKAGVELFNTETIPEAASWLKNQLPTYSSMSLYRTVWKSLSGKTYDYEKDGYIAKEGTVQREWKSRKDSNTLIAGQFRIKKVSNNLLRLREETELNLIKRYRNLDENHPFRNSIFSEFYRRYTGFLKLQANRLFTKVPVDKFHMGFEDCENEAIKCLQLAMGYFKVENTTDNFDSSKFSISWYVSQEMRAKISSYHTKLKAKRKRPLDEVTIDFSNQHSDEEEGFNAQYLVDTRYCPEDLFEKNEVQNTFDKLDTRLSGLAKRVKDYLMKGYRDSRIQKDLNLKKKQLDLYKNQIRNEMVKLELNKI